MKNSFHIPFKAILLLPAMLLLLASCSEDDQHVLSLLEKAETYLPEKPDSAEMCLDSIAQPANLSESDKALFGLLRSATDNRQGKGVKSDSLIRDSYEYFHKSSQQGNSSDSLLLCRYAQSCYYMSLYYASCDSTKQREDMLRLAIKCSERGKDWHTCYLAYTQLGKSILLSNPEHAITLSKKALSTYYKINDDINNEILILGHIAGAYLTNAELGSAMEYYDKGYKLAKSRKLRKSENEMSMGMAGIYLYMNKPEMALNYAKRGVETAGDAVHTSSLIALAQCYQACDSLSKAKELYQSIAHDTEDMAEQYLISKGLFSIAIQNKNYEELLAYLDSTYDCMENIFLQSLRVKDEYYQGYLEKELQKERLENKSEHQAWMLGASISLLIMLILLIYNQTQKQKQEQQKKAHELETKQQIIDANKKMLQYQQKLIHQKELSLTILRSHLLVRLEYTKQLFTGQENVKLTDGAWADIEQLMNDTDNDFVKKLRQQHPTFDKSEIRLCILTRLNITNATIANIFCIGESAVKKRKSTLKKKGFLIEDPNTTLEKILEHFSSSEPFQEEGEDVLFDE